MDDVSERDVRCGECGALEGSPCVALGSSKYRVRGEAINGFHVKRTMRLRYLYGEALTPASEGAGDK